MAVFWVEMPSRIFVFRVKKSADAGGILETRLHLLTFSIHFFTLKMNRGKSQQMQAEFSKLHGITNRKTVYVKCSQYIQKRELIVCHNHAMEWTTGVRNPEKARHFCLFLSV
jgi:hypothetical protein